MSTTIKLTTPINAHGDAIDEIVLRDPTPADARVIKAMPYWVDKDENVQLNPTAAAQYLVKCGSIPMSSVDELDLNDFNTLCWAIAGFFFKGKSRTPTT